MATGGASPEVEEGGGGGGGGPMASDGWGCRCEVDAWETQAVELRGDTSAKKALVVMADDGDDGRR
jgi:hypothetical protein